MQDKCWLWGGSIHTNDYGIMYYEKKRYRAHRFVYEALVGAIPEGLVLDHLCRVTRCVNPEHLEPVTNKENILRGTCPMAENARKTHCPNGHRYTKDNTIVTKRGYRKCRTCNRKYCKNNYTSQLTKVGRVRVKSVP